MVAYPTRNSPESEMIEDPVEREELARTWMPLTRRLAKDWAASTGLPVDELEGEARVGLVAALNGYEDDRGASFGTYAYLCVRQMLSRYADSSRRSKRRATRGYGDHLRAIREDRSHTVLEAREAAERVRELVSPDDWDVLWRRFAAGEMRTEVARSTGWSKQGLLLRERRLVGVLRDSVLEGYRC